MKVKSCIPAMGLQLFQFKRQTPAASAEKNYAQEKQEQTDKT